MSNPHALPRITILKTPVLGWLLGRTCAICLRLCGWRLAGEVPRMPKYVFTMAPHTSNWDFLILMATISANRIPAFWMAKEAMFHPRFFFRWLGGVPVNRSKAKNIVEQIVEVFDNNDECALGIAPEGTRKFAERWKTGFWRMAKGADVPIVMAFLDYRTKRAGFGPSLILGDDMDADIATIQEFYSHITPRKPENTTCGKDVIID